MIFAAKTDYVNNTIVSLAQDAIDKKELVKDSARLHLTNRAALTRDQSQDSKKLEIKRRVRRAVEINGPRILVFDQLSFSKEIEEAICASLPKSLQVLDPKPAVQIIQGGLHCTPHKDHSRTACLFFLLTDPNVRTTWWEKVQDFVEYDDLRYADIDKIRPVHDEIIQTYSWYVFNNQEYHSVHSMTGENINRQTVLIEFDKLSADELYNIINERTTMST